MNDLISRQAAIQWVKTECNPYGNPTLDFESGKKVIKHLEQMPSAQSERPKGHWIDTGSGQECSECGEVQYGYDNFRYYCAKCGSDNRGKKDG